MSTPQGISLKRERAKEHLEAIKTEVERLTEVLSREGVSFERNAETGQCVWTFRAPVTTTDRVAILTGDFVHNLRSLLDHIVFHFADPKQRRPLPEFPIYENPGPGDDGFYPAGIMKIWSVPMEVKVIIEGLQPYNGGNQPLLHIQRLDNIDKHRRILAAAHAVTNTRFYGPAIDPHTSIVGATEDDKGSTITLSGNIAIRAGRFSDGDIIATAPASEDCEKMGFQPGFNISLDEPGINHEIVGELTNLYQFVENIVLPKLEPLF